MSSQKKFSVLILTIGIPGAGKTRWVEEYKKNHPLTYVISTDAIRKEVTGVEQCINPAQNSIMHEEARKRVQAIINDPASDGGIGPEIIVDSTNVEVEEWMAYKSLGASAMIARIFDVSPETAIARQNQRDRHVPEHIIKWKYNLLQSNKKFLPLLFNMILYE